jgi:hypothetical protein
MSNKKKADENQDVLKQAAVQAEERRKLIAEFNTANMGKYWIDPERTPTDEDIKKAKEAFDEHTKFLQTKDDYLVADKTNALRVANFIREFNKNSSWEGRMFVGVLRFDDQIAKFIKDFDEKNPVDLVLDFGAVQYLFLVFDKYKGVGIEEARHMAEIWDEYVPIYDRLHELVDWYNQQNNKCKDLQTAWAMMEQGYYMHIMEDTEVDPTEQQNQVPAEENKEEVAE